MPDPGARIAPSTGRPRRAQRRCTIETIEQPTAAARPPRARRQAPSIPPGWTVGPPDFIGVGVHKAGTTWWFNLLVAHPRIDGEPARKELHMLGQLRRKELTPERLAWYHRQFPRAPGHQAGEWTPRYMAMPAIPAIIEQVAPDARLLAIVREPVDRYQSGLSQWLELAREDPDDVDERAGQREALMRGFYGRQVQRLVEVVGADRLLVLQYERCALDAQAQYDRTLAFLGLDPYRLEPGVTPEAGQCDRRGEGAAHASGRGAPRRRVRPGRPAAHEPGARPRPRSLAALPRYRATLRPSSAQE